MSNKFVDDVLKFEIIKNNDLVCKDCEYCFDDEKLPCNTSKCMIYEMKPDEVIDGGDCIKYEKKI
ncbi:MAG: hypothetical protein ACLU1S_08050 [Eubacterium sp.]